ncbi:MAG: hypothetical protein KF830_15110 [Planctomycetes bacterium]|nr:hypothetical protein [Planctomycetota bacterium]
MLSALLSPFMAAQATLISDVGCGLPGTMGASEHTVLEDGGYLHFRVDNVPPESQVVLVVGLAAIWLPIFGGIVVPSPDALVEVAADSQGRAVFHMPIPSMHSLTIFSQYGFEDDGAPMGIALSNAVMVVAIECSDIMCPRTPNQAVALDMTPATAELTVQFKLTGGNSGFVRLKRAPVNHVNGCGHSSSTTKLLALMRTIPGLR